MNIRKYISISVFGAMLLFGIAACDKIEPPYRTDFEGNGHNGGEVVRKVLLEEFTGHQCPQCPAGSDIAYDLKAYYGDRLVLMKIHSGYFARVSDGMFSYDFTNAAGDAIADYFSVELNPRGLVNRKVHEGSLQHPPEAWGDAISQIIDLAPEFHIEIYLEYQQGNLDVNIEVTSLITCLNTYYISAFLTEDGIISPQRTNNPNYPTGVIEDYEHNHVLRKDVNGVWGELMNEGDIAPQDQFNHTYQVQLDSHWVPENMSVIAFVYNASNKEIIQVEIEGLSTTP